MTGVGDGTLESGDDAFSVVGSLSGHDLTIVVTGEFDLGASAHWTKVVPPMTTDAVRTIHVDLSAVEFMDSSGLGLLVRLHQQLEGSDTTLHLRNVPENVRRVLDYAGVTTMFDLSAP